MKGANSFRALHPNAIMSFDDELAVSHGLMTDEEIVQDMTTLLKSMTKPTVIITILKLSWKDQYQPNFAQPWT